MSTVEGRAATDEEVAHVLTDLLGDRARRLSPVHEVAGACLSIRVEPGDVDQLAATLKALHQLECPAIVIGGGSRIESAPPCPSARVLLSTEALRGVLTFDLDEGVMEVAAGTPLLELVDLLEGTIWELPLDPPGDSATLGGVLAAAAEGPRRNHYGRVRDVVLGLEVVLADGTRTRCGGRVVKNVTGYDLAKLYVGSNGTLGVIASAWLRLRPRPGERRLLSAVFEDRARAVAAAISVGRMSSARSVTLVSGNLASEVSGLAAREAAWVLAVELAGSGALCTRDAAEFISVYRGEERSFSPDGVGALLSTKRSWAQLARLPLLPSELESATRKAHEAGLSMVVHPNPCVLYVGFDRARVDHSEEVRSAIRDVAGSVSGRLVMECNDAAPSADRATQEAPGTELALIRAVKKRFDPQFILNPGRLGGGI